MTEEYKRGVREVKARAIEDQTAVNTKTMITKILNQLAAMEKEVSEQHEDLTKTNARLRVMDGLVTPKYIISDKYKKWHVCQQWQDRAAKEWKTECGWRYGRSSFERRSVIPGGPHR